MNIDFAKQIKKLKDLIRLMRRMATITAITTAPRKAIKMQMGIGNLSGLSSLLPKNEKEQERDFD